MNGGLLTQCSGRGAKMLAESAPEMTGVGKAAAPSDLVHREGPEPFAYQHGTRPFQSQAHQLASEGGPPRGIDMMHLPGRNTVCAGHLLHAQVRRRGQF